MSVWDGAEIQWERPGGSRGVGFLKIVLKSAFRGAIFGLLFAAVWQVWYAVAR
jgi:hypothetical protein